MTGFLILFFLMLGMPLLVAGIYRRSRKGKILQIRQDYVRDVRYFGHSFAAMVEKALPEMQKGMLQLSRAEAVLEIGQEQSFAEPEIDRLVLALQEPFCPQGEGICFRKEIYCIRDAVFTAKEIRLRAVFSRNRILLGNGAKLVRWMDADRTVAIYDHCELGRSVSSGEQLILGFDNTFSRLYAPKIRLGQRPEDADCLMEQRDADIFRLPVTDSFDHNARYISDDMVSVEGTVPYTILTRFDLKIVDGLIVQGDVHSDGSVRIMENAAVLGNVFAEKNVLLEENATVLGNIFTQGNIICEKGACVGRPGRICSMVARGTIEFAGKNDVFGYISSEAGGYIREQEAVEEDADGNEIPPVYCFPPKLVYQEKLTFGSLEEYLCVDDQGFRKDEHLQHAELPAGAEEIPASQFFACGNLKQVLIPASIKRIGAYAFADCRKLRCSVADCRDARAGQGQRHDLDACQELKNCRLEHIGTSAFENCEKLEI